MTSLSRRTLLSCAAACGAGLLSACAGGRSAPEARPAAADGSLVALADIPVGEAVSVKAPDGTTVLVARPAEDEAVAFSAVCPHEGCSVAPGDGELACPCHGSRFETLTGKVTGGPAQRDLTEYAVSVVDGKVMPA